MSALNVLWIGIDDVGENDVNWSKRAASEATPRTAIMDALAAAGVWARNHWVQPACTMTRASWWTGRNPGRTRATQVIQQTDTNNIVSRDEVFLPKALKACVDESIATALFGKWHITDAAAGGVYGPNLSGFDEWYGPWGNLLGGETYTNWTAFRNGNNVGLQSAYATTDLVDEASDWIQAQTGRWFCSLQLGAPHAPYHQPPVGLTTFDTSPEDGYGNAAPDTDEFFAMLQAADTEIGRLLTEISIDYAETLLIITSDNGTPAAFVHPPYDPSGPPRSGAKGTTSRLGCCVPFIARGPGVTGGRVIHPVISAVDMLPTIIHAMGGNPAEVVAAGKPLDGVSLMPLLFSDTALPPRDFAYSESGEGTTISRRSVAGQRFHLHQLDGEGELYHDMLADPFELVNLLDRPLVGPAALAYPRLRAKMNEYRAAGRSTPVSVRL